MRLLVKRADNLINELRFVRGPIYIGRQIGSQVFLPDRAVSRQHTVLYTSTDGKWIVEDLDSANKTYLNDEVVHKAEIKDGDIMGVADFKIEVHMDDLPDEARSVSLEDTLYATLHEPQIVLRQMESSDAPLIRMQAKRARDFSYASSILLKCYNLEQLLAAVLDLIFKQFRTYQMWVALRKSPTGPMNVAKGKRVGGETAKLEELQLEPRINEAVRTHHYILIPRVPAQAERGKIHSAMVVPIMCNKACYGVIYADNSLDHEHYGLNDLDYLILLSLMIGGYIDSMSK